MANHHTVKGGAEVLGQAVSPKIFKRGTQTFGRYVNVSRYCQKKVVYTPLKILARRLWRRLTVLPAALRDSEEARLMLARLAHLHLLGALRAPILHWNTPHFHISD